LSADLHTLDLFPASHAAASSPTALLAPVESASWGRLYRIAWYGSGQIAMKQQDNWWGDDEYTDRGNGSTAKGSSKPSWIDYDGDGDTDEWADVWDPIAYKFNSKPSLKATFLVDKSLVSSIQVQAQSIDGGPEFFFTGSAKGNKSSISVTMKGTDTVGGLIDNRDVVLDWSVSINHGSFEDIGTTTQRLFVLCGKPLDTSTNSPTAVRIWYSIYYGTYQRSDRMDMADDIAQDAQNKFNYNYTYIKENAWQVIYTGGDCGSCSWLMHNELAVLGASAEVRYVFPQHYNWKGLYSTTGGHNEVRKGGGAYLFYVDAGGSGNNYEGCCFVKYGTNQRYYLGGYGGYWEPTAYDVLMEVSGPNTSGYGAHQAWSDAWYTPVSYPSGKIPTGIVEAGVAETDWRALLQADGSLLRKKVEAPVAAASSASTATPSVTTAETTASRIDNPRLTQELSQTDRNALAAAFALLGSSGKGTSGPASSADSLMAGYADFDSA